MVFPTSQQWGEDVGSLLFRASVDSARVISLFIPFCSLIHPSSYPILRIIFITRFSITNSCAVPLFFFKFYPVLESRRLGRWGKTIQNPTLQPQSARRVMPRGVSGSFTFVLKNPTEVIYDGPGDL